MKKMLWSVACSAAVMITGASQASAATPSRAPSTPALAATAPVPAAPPAPGPAPGSAPPTVSYTVAPGDTLWQIAAAKLGRGERWGEIYALNRDALQSPDRIEPGQVLQVPSGPGQVAPVVPAVRSAAPPRAGAAQATPKTSTGARPTSAGPATSSSGGADGALAGIRRCESGGNYQAVSPGGQYRGAYQFDTRTWQAVGGTGDPAAASPAEQDARARTLMSQRGSAPWSHCG